MNHSLWSDTSLNSGWKSVVLDIQVIWKETSEINVFHYILVDTHDYVSIIIIIRFTQYFFSIVEAYDRIGYAVSGYIRQNLYRSLLWQHVFCNVVIPKLSWLYSHKSNVLAIFVGKTVRHAIIIGHAIPHHLLEAVGSPPDLPQRHHDNEQKHTSERPGFKSKIRFHCRFTKIKKRRATVRGLSTSRLPPSDLTTHTSTERLTP